MNHVEHRNPRWLLHWIVLAIICLLFWAAIASLAIRAVDGAEIATTWVGLRGDPRLTASASCRASGHESVWVAETGSELLDIIQVGEIDGRLFYAYGRGVPNGPGSLYVEQRLGSAGTGWHRYGLALAAHRWTLTIDGRVVARIDDTFRTWRLRATQVMAEGDLPFGPAACTVTAGRWSMSGYGPLPPFRFGPTWWEVG